MRLLDEISGEIIYVLINERSASIDAQVRKYANVSMRHDCIHEICMT